jgi:hypothetical protein
MQRNRQQQHRRLQGLEVVPLRRHRDQVTRPQLGPRLAGAK